MDIHLMQRPNEGDLIPPSSVFVPGLTRILVAYLPKTRSSTVQLNWQWYYSCCTVVPADALYYLVDGWRVIVYATASAVLQGFRKPDLAAYDVVCQHLDIVPEQAIIIDDRKVNIDAALEHGMRGIHMSTADKLREQLRLLDFDV